MATPTRTHPEMGGKSIDRDAAPGRRRSEPSPERTLYRAAALVGSNDDPALALEARLDDS